jgi:molecular chaperone Hsp33
MSLLPSASDPNYADCIQPFLIDHSAIRGRFARLEETVNTILNQHDYPESVAIHLAEQLVLAALLAATLSGKGILTVQVKGEGAVRFMVVDVMANGTIRGYARIDREQVAEIERAHEGGLPPASALIGKGYLAVTLDSGRNDRYQSIVELGAERLSDAFQSYFTQSHQAEVSLQVAVSPPRTNKARWRAGGIIVERMPLLGGKKLETSLEEQDELWRRTLLFMQTLTEREVLDPRVTPQNLLYRLFNEDGVWVYKLQPLKAGCRCSRAKMRHVLKTLPQEELFEILNEGKLVMDCEFCGRKEKFTRADIRRLHPDTAS